MSNAVPDGWSVKPLESLLYRPLAYGVLKPGNNIPNGIPVVRIQDIRGNRLNFDGLYRITPELHKEFRRTQLNEGDLIISLVGTIGKTFVITKKLQNANVTRAFGVIGVKDDHSPDFVTHSLNSDSSQQWIEDQSQGNAQKVLNLGVLKQFPLQLPPLPEQQKIAAILSSVDDVIEKTQAQIDKLKDLKTGMMQELLTKGVGRTEFKDSPVGRIPVGWDVFSAQALIANGSLLKLQDGNHGSQYPRTSEFLPEGVPYISASHISELGEIDFENCPHLSQERSDEMRIRPATGGDVILTHNATVGRTAIIPDDKVEVVASTSTTYYRTNPSKILNKYLFYYFQSTTFVAQLNSIMGQTTRNQVPITAQRELDIVLPSLAEQLSIANAIDSIVNRVKVATSKYEKLTNIKKALMQDLLTGKVRVSTTK